MRSILFTFILAFMVLVSYSQAPAPVNTTINCFISDRHVNYGHLAELLPEDMQKDLLVDPRKEFNMRNEYNILLWLEQRGWKLVSVDDLATSSLGALYQSRTFILSKEIYLDPSARAEFLQKLESLEKKRNK